MGTKKLRVGDVVIAVTRYSGTLWVVTGYTGERNSYEVHKWPYAENDWLRYKPRNMFRIATDEEKLLWVLKNSK